MDSVRPRFYAFSGRFPFEGRSATEILAKQVTEAPPPLASMGVSVPRKLRLLIDRCLAKDPSKRSANADALAEQLGVAMDQRRELARGAARIRATQWAHGWWRDSVDGGRDPHRVDDVGAIAGSAPGWITFCAWRDSSRHSPLRFRRRAASEARLHARRSGPAFRAEIENSREERAVGRGIGRSSVEWLLSRVARVSASFTCVAVPVIAITSCRSMARTSLMVATPIIANNGRHRLLSGTGYLAVVQTRRDVRR
jgi:hypothetical protein